MALPATRAITSFVAASFVILSTAFLIASPSFAQGVGDSPEMQAVQAVEAVLQASDDETRRAFMVEHLDDDYVASMGDAAMLVHLAELQRAVSGAGGLDILLSPDGVRMMYSGATSTTIGVEFAGDSSGRITSLSILSQETGGVDPNVDSRLMAIGGLGQAVGDDALALFAEEHLAPNFRASLSRENLIQLLSDIRRYAAMAGTVEIRGSAEGYRIGFRDPESADILVQVESQPPHQITSLKLDTDIEDAEVTQIEPINWGNLEERLAQEEEAGFAGTILVVRDGDVVLDRGYGLANRAQGISNTSETIFDIGSTPIDFTRAAVLKLVDLGILELDAPISRYLPDVPPDKAGITINHLMSGVSGLPNFHHITGVDDDYDLSYIDRGEAIRRILGQQLLFEPGEGRAHSHSAFGLLAAIIEIVSGDSYGDFLESHFFEPAGMFQTGFYGDTQFAEEAYAVGYGFSSVGRINIPMHWGPTSWLVMGGGGMVSNPADLRRFLEYIREGGLSDAAQETFFVDGVLAGGTDRGFLCMLSHAPDTTFCVCSNAHEQHGDRAMAVARALAEMVRPEG